MDAFELHTPQGKPAGVYACYKCRRVHAAEKSAAECCLPHLCACGAVCKPRAFLQCSKCRAEQQHDRMKERWKKATKISSDAWKGPVYDDDHDRFFADISELEYEIGNEEYEPGPYLYGCNEVPLQLDACAIVEHALEEHHEGAEVSSHEIDMLQKMLDGWAKEQEVVSWETDYTRGLLRGS